MKTLIQLAVGGGAMCLAAPLLYETPLYNTYIFLPIFLGSMYATALVQHWFHWRRSRRG